ncbi:MAG TPA: adenylosuccinate lyase [Caldithrix sp.]|nr:adenylosuccinate lyase [Calditrichaceae bacterium]HEM49180.1 adenylosuccinate lyase [Caldithrix sp.]HES59526.1 adenylosuccinate lyase [Caldithrix sp.]
MFKEISPLDGRYADRLSHLGNYFSEFALMRSRVLVELRFLLALDESGLFKKFAGNEIEKIQYYQNNFSDIDYQRIKEIEKTTNHDVKSCEIFLQEKLGLSHPNMIHFGLTSEDVNNLAYTFLFKDYLEKEQLPQIETVLKNLVDHAANWKDVPFPARTHGQMASPSTGGKEMAVFLIRLLRQFEKLKSFTFLGKLNGATGNYSALKAAFPKYNWIAFSEKFMQKYGLKNNPVTTQIEDHDTWAEYFSITKRINNIILDMDRDIWLYLTLGYLTISADKGAVGSSTMPHKVNPINFENSEGNMQVSTALLNGLIDKLGNSRLQRDLSDSTVTRNVGVALAHSYLAIQETIKGLKKLSINKVRCEHELNAHPELLAEPIQTILRREDLENPYNLLKELTRGQDISKDDLGKFIDQLDIENHVKNELKSLSVMDYMGEAKNITERVIKEAKTIIN